MSRLFATLIALFVCIPDGLGQEPSTRYFIAMFSAQRPGLVVNPNYTHTFGTVVRIVPGRPVETFTISWLPISGRVRSWAVRSEPGRNYGLEETVDKAIIDRECVSMWGPFEIHSQFGENFIRRKCELDSGGYRYRAVDNFIRETEVTDCIHAITDIDTAFNRTRYPLSRFGDRATEFIVANMVRRDGTIGGEKTNEWIIPVLGLEGYPIERRTVTRRQYPLSSITSGFQRFGTEGATAIDSRSSRPVDAGVAPMSVAP